MAGILYGVGVGPGDAQLLTLKARDILERVPIIAVPVKKIGEESTAAGIIRPVVSFENKELMPLEFPMEHSKSSMANSHEAAAKAIAGRLVAGYDVALITLGDVSVYSTCAYVLERVRAAGFDTQIIPGIPSFCGGAALAQISLVQGHENLAVVSGLRGREDIEKVLDDFDNIVMMKAGRQIPLISEILAQRQLLEQAVVVSNAGMENEYIGPVDDHRDYGYFTTLIVKKGRKKQ